MILGKGNLTKLAELKEKHADEFRAEAGRKRICGACLKALCIYAIAKAYMGRDGLLHIRQEWCSLKRCPRDKEEETDEEDRQTQ